MKIKLLSLSKKRLAVIMFLFLIIVIAGFILLIGSSDDDHVASSKPLIKIFSNTSTEWQKYTTKNYTVSNPPDWTINACVENCVDTYDISLKSNSEKSSFVQITYWSPVINCDIEQVKQWRVWETQETKEVTIKDGEKITIVQGTQEVNPLVDSNKVEHRLYGYYSDSRNCYQVIASDGKEVGIAEKIVRSLSFFSNKIAFARDGDIWLANFDGSETEKMYETTKEGIDNPVNLTWSPDAKYIAFIYLASLPPDYPQSKGDNVFLLNVQERKLLQMTRSNGYTNATANPLIWSPDGKLIATIHWEVDKGKNTATYWPEVWSTDGKLVWSFKDSRLSTQSPNQNYRITGWSPDSTSIYLSIGDKELYTIKVDSSEVTNLTSQTKYSSLISGNISPNGKLAAYEKEGNVWIINLENRKHIQLTTDGNPVKFDEKFGKSYVDGERSYHWMQWSPNSKYISAVYFFGFTAAGAVSIPEGISVIDIDSRIKRDVVLPEFPKHAPLFDYFWLDDSSRLLAVTEDEEIFVLNPEDGTSIKTVDNAFWATTIH